MDRRLDQCRDSHQIASCTPAPPARSSRRAFDWDGCVFPLPCLRPRSKPRELPISDLRRSISLSMRNLSRAAHWIDTSAECAGCIAAGVTRCCGFLKPKNDGQSRESPPACTSSRLSPPQVRSRGSKEPPWHEMLCCAHSRTIDKNSRRLCSTRSFSATDNSRRRNSKRDCSPYSDSSANHPVTEPVSQRGARTLSTVSAFRRMLSLPSGPTRTRTPA